MVFLRNNSFSKMDGTGLDDSEVQSTCKDILKNMKAREQHLKSIVENLNLSSSDFSAAIRNKIQEMSLTLVNLGVPEVNKENIIDCHIRKTLSNHEDLSHYSKLTLYANEIKNKLIVCKGLNASYNRAIKMYQHEISKMNQELHREVGPTPLSPEGKNAVIESLEKRELQRRVTNLCNSVTVKKKEIARYEEKLAAFDGVPPDVETAVQTVFLKKRELENLCDQLEL